MNADHYGNVTDTSVVDVELKKKFNGVVYKRRIPMTLCQGIKYLYYGIRWAEESQIWKEIDYVLNLYELRHAADDRVAYYGKMLPDKERILMEVKIPGAIPLRMRRDLKAGETY